MTAYDCRQCGACCAGQLVIVTPGDKVPKKWRDGVSMRQTNGRCVALQGVVGVGTMCAIYNKRPSMCRYMRPGDWACKNIRANAGFQP